MNGRWSILNTFILPACLCMLMAACRPGEKNKTTAIIPRNETVNKNNAYNAIFLDSAAVEKFIIKQQLDDTIANAMRSFYNARNFEYAWFDSQGLTEQALGFRSLYSYSHDTSAGTKQLENRLNDLLMEDDSTISANAPIIIKTELQLTQRFIQYALHTYKDLRTAQLVQFIPIQKQRILELADSVLANDSRNHRRYEAATPAYGSMKEQLQQYVGIAKEGGWPSISTAQKKYKKGDQAPAIARFKKRLQITGELPGKDSTLLFDAALETAVKAFQLRHGYTPNGIINDTLAREMNVPVLARVQQLLINMERMRWMPGALEGRLIIVNIPEFILHVWEGKRKVFDMAVVVGREGHSTTMFYGDLNQIVFNPYWHVPRSIVRKDLLPALAKNGNYLQENDMEITGERNGLPVIRQRPGKKNALGRVKFLFPNSFNIYLHDTPVKDLFNKDKRAYSHGCIRLSNPVKMANYLLQDMPDWTPEKVDSAIHKGKKETYVKLQHPVPVLITYYTAWVDEQGVLQFREDIYGHDHRLAQKMFTDAQPVL